MRHLLTVRHIETQRREMPSAEASPISAVDFARSMAEAGILVGSDAPHSGRRLGRPEPRAGSYLIDVASTDEALSWAARHPGAREGVVEVRPVWAWAGHG